MLEATKNQPQYYVLMITFRKQPEPAANIQTNRHFQINLCHQQCSVDQDKSFICFYSIILEEMLLEAQNFSGFMGKYHAFSLTL